MATPPESAGSPRTLAIVRHELTKLASRRATRALGWPRDWQPTSVRDPRSSDGRLFTHEGAWEFIEECLAAGHPIDEIVLEIPPGKPGYVLCIGDLQGGAQVIYVKLEMGTGTVLGRSFHYSYRKQGKGQDE
jgi:hypothetical protein